MIYLTALPILFAFFLGIQFPFIALNLSSLAIFILGFMMMISSLDFHWGTLKKINLYYQDISWGLFFHFLFFPLITWFFAYFLISEESLRLGMVMASICPIAIVAPMFTKKHNGDEHYSFIMLILSMIIFPLFFPFVIKFIMNIQNIQILPIMIDMLLLTTVPLALGLVIKNYFAKLSIFLKINLFWLNIFSISFLAFIYMGASISKLNLSYLPFKEIFIITIILLLTDFGVLKIMEFLSEHFSKSKEVAISMSINTSMKNFAISGAILLFYDPKASLASALGFLVHAFYFQYINLRKNIN